MRSGYRPPGVVPRPGSGAIRFLLCVPLIVVVTTARAGVVVTQTTDEDRLRNALEGNGLSIDAIRVTNGRSDQFGVYEGFSVLGDGVVMSSGRVVEAAGPPTTYPPPPDGPIDLPSTDMEIDGTAEFDAYGGTGVIENFQASFDVARLVVDFTLDDDSAVAFSFVFGSVEYPNWVSSYTDSFLVFLDGLDPANQITFDSNGVPVQVGKSFSDRIVLENVETAFGDPHGYIPRLKTTTSTLAAGEHTLYFEVGDVNDHILDSAVFLTNLRATQPVDSDEDADTEFEPEDNPGVVPEPSSMALLTAAAGSLALSRAIRRLRRRP